MFPRAHLLVLLPLAFACESNPKTLSQDSTRQDTVSSVSADEPIWRARWIIGEHYDNEIDTSQTSRFRVRAALRRRSGILTVHLDTAPSGTAGRQANFTAADSIKITGLAPRDRFTQGCRQQSEPPPPIIAVHSDTIEGRWGRPRYAWLLDTIAVRIRPLSINSVTCNNPAAD
jgi:hypothetical protein